MKHSKKGYGTNLEKRLWTEFRKKFTDRIEKKGYGQNLEKRLRAKFRKKVTDKRTGELSDDITT